MLDFDKNLFCFLSSFTKWYETDGRTDRAKRLIENVNRVYKLNIESLFSILIFFTDSLFLDLRLPSYKDCGQLLKMSDILMALHSYLDLSLFVPANDADASKSVMFREIESNWKGDLASLKTLMMSNKNRAGSFKMEFPFCDEYLSVPISFITLREKCYFLSVLHQKTVNSNIQLDGKIASRCAVKKSRMLSYTIADYVRMSETDRVKYVSGLVALRSKRFKMYEVTQSRAEPVPFSRKRWINENGSSNAFGHYLNGDGNGDGEDGNGDGNYGGHDGQTDS